MKKIRFGRKSYIVMTEEELDNIRDRGMWLYASASADLEMFKEFVNWKRNNDMCVENTKKLIPKWKFEVEEDYRKFLDSTYW